MANRFWVGGTGTWDSTSTTHWAATSGGSSGASAPVAGDAVTFDANSGGGTVTPDASIDSIAFLSLAAGAFTGTLAFNTHNPNMSFTSVVSFSGSGVRTINMGSGTWTITGGTGNVWDCGTVTNLTATFSNATIAFAGASSNRTFAGGGRTYGAFTVANNSTKGSVTITGANTFSSVTIGSGNTLLPQAGVTTTISGALTITGTSSAPSGLMQTGNPGATVSVGSASPLDWCAVFWIAKSGAGSITATNSFDLGRNTSVTITAPSGGGGGGGQRVISG